MLDLETKAALIIVTPRLVDLLEDKDSVTKEEIEQYHKYADGLTEWAYNNRDPDFFRTLLSINKNLFEDRYEELFSLCDQELLRVANRVVESMEAVNAGHYVEVYP